MALVLSNLYIALREVGVEEERATKAVEEVMSAGRSPSDGWRQVQQATSSASNLVLVYMCGIATGLLAALLLARW